MCPLKVHIEQISVVNYIFRYFVFRKREKEKTPKWNMNFESNIIRHVV